MALAESTVAVMLPDTDADRAQKYYTEMLGLPYAGTNEEGAPTYTLGGGTMLVLLPRPDSTPSESTALSFEVADVVSELRALEGHGVTFEDYDIPGLRTVDHVCVLGSDKAAWFKDPDGNVLCLHETLG
jgi:catechol 2,3-dioxygenase-like lactoylglutathione lyase family enzyme